MKHKLVYYFYIPKEETPILKLHYACLKEFATVFNSALFVLGIDDLDDIDTIIKYEKTIIELGFTNIQFKVCKNDPLLREVPTFKNEIIDKLESLSDELVFFAHNKGATNNINDSLKYWIVSMYYFSLYDINKVDRIFTNVHDIIGAGSPGCKIWKQTLNGGKYYSFFVGTMYWLSPAGILNAVKSAGCTLPVVHDRFYAEEFFPLLLKDVNTDDFLYSMNDCWFINDTEWFKESFEYLKQMNNEKFNEYNEFYNKIINNINE